MTSKRVALCVWFGSFGILSSSCGGSLQRPTVPDAPTPIEGRLLLFPHANAESLLGREVTRSERGGYRIADSRAPGCDVSVHRTKAQYHALRETKTSELAVLGASYQAIISLEVKFGQGSQARLELDNKEMLEADLRGPCGKTVITKVFVGHGSRRVFAASSKEASVSVSAIAEGGSKASGSDVDELAWHDDQAYAFDVKDLAPAVVDVPTVDVHLPSFVTEGDEVHIEFASAKEAWLVVYYVDADNRAEVLWPSNEEPSPCVKPNKVKRLPSPAEEAAGIKIRPVLSKPGVVASEQLVVYAFADKRDFDLVRPPSGSISAAGVTFADELVNKLRDVPASRWSRRQLGYTITPAKK